jgi:hypothetical protein
VLGQECKKADLYCESSFWILHTIVTVGSLSNSSYISEFHEVLYSLSGGTVVKVLRYKSEGRWFDSRWCYWNFPLT